jgi:hypothetical protein
VNVKYCDRTFGAKFLHVKIDNLNDSGVNLPIAVHIMGLARVAIPTWEMYLYYVALRTRLINCRDGDIHVHSGIVAFVKRFCH